LIVDDHERLLATAQALLTREGLDVVGTATTQDEALEKAEQLQPDVVLVDINLGRDSGIELAHCLVKRFPQLSTSVVLSSEAVSGWS
jgi:DNA-binding NarL/FixJ family response regulator